jgi:hypothetical protein
MPASTAAPPRRKKTPKSTGVFHRRIRSGAPAASARWPLATWRLRPIAAVAVVVFLVAYVLDWGAVARLIWMCLVGQLGPLRRIASFGILLLLGCTLAWAWHRPTPRRIVNLPERPDDPPRSRNKLHEPDPRRRFDRGQRSCQRSL